MADMDNVSSDQIGAGDNKVYGGDIGPMGGQDMFDHDKIAGDYPANARDADPGSFTGGKGPAGLGGMSEGLAPGGVSEPGTEPGTLYERRGF